MIRHAVYLSLVRNANAAELANVMQGLADLVGKVEGFVAFEHGPNLDLEGKSPEAPYGFVCTMTDADALDRYAKDPRHLALGARLVALCGDGDGIKVYDLNTGG